MAYAPERGEAIWITLTPQASHEQQGRRPALVLTPRKYNEMVGLVIACPITSQVKGYTFEVALPAGLPITGVILADHVKSLDWKARQAVPICAVPAPILAAVLARLQALLALPAV